MICCLCSMSRNACLGLEATLLWWLVGWCRYNSHYEAPTIADALVLKMQVLAAHVSSLSSCHIC